MLEKLQQTFSRGYTGRETRKKRFHKKIIFFSSRKFDLKKKVFEIFFFKPNFRDEKNLRFFFSFFFSCFSSSVAPRKSLLQLFKHYFGQCCNFEKKSNVFYTKFTIWTSLAANRLLRKTRFSEGGLMFPDFDSGKPSGFLFFPKSQSKIRAGFYLFQKNRPLRGRVFIMGIFYKEIPTNNSIFSKISARFARGLLFIPIFFSRASRAGFYSFQFSQNVPWVLFFSIFDFSRTSPGF